MLHYYLCHDIAEILLKLALNTYQSINQSIITICFNKLQSILFPYRDRRGRDRMVVGLTTICPISAYHH